MKALKFLTLGAIALSFFFFLACSPEHPVSAPEPETAGGEVEAVPEEVIAVRDAALAYVEQTQSMDGLTDLSGWAGRNIVQPNIVGQGAYQFTSGAWMVAVSYPVVAPEYLLYTVQISNAAVDFMWSGTVLPDGTVSEIEGSAPEAEPEGATTVVGWFGNIERLPVGSRYDDRLVLANGAGEIALEGATPELQARIADLRDREEPGRFAHFWGRLTCGVPDVGGCQLLVSRIHAGSETAEVDPVSGWEGTLVSNPGESQFDDYFVLNGAYPLAFGIHSLDKTVEGAIRALRDTGVTIRVWGGLRTGVPDAFGSQIDVVRIEVDP